VGEPGKLQLTVRRKGPKIRRFGGSAIVTAGRVLDAGCRPDGTNCRAGATPVPLPIGFNVADSERAALNSFLISTTTINDLSQNAAGNFAGRIEQTTLAAHLRPNQQFSSAIFISNSADSVYHSLQTTVRKRFSQGLLFNFAYTSGKAIDSQSGDPVGTSYPPTTSTLSLFLSKNGASVSILLSGSFSSAAGSSKTISATFPIRSENCGPNATGRIHRKLSLYGLGMPWTSAC